MDTSITKGCLHCGSKRHGSLTCFMGIMTANEVKKRIKKLSDMKIEFKNHKAYANYAITIFKGYSSITQYGGKEKNSQHEQYIRIPNRVLRELVKFYLDYKELPCKKN